MEPNHADPQHEPGSPEGMSSRQVDGRSELSRWISGTHAFPADRDTLLERARSQSAPDGVLAAIRSLPDRVYDNMEAVAEQLGLSGGSSTTRSGQALLQPLAIWRTCGGSGAPKTGQHSGLERQPNGQWR
ncbi:DUF2795 domain-containing protein [Nonomuraea recticatena]|uniref:DUF2795 domain-containing protein n=1 Tax=Nonomuraea recticatena TaxID=46178 RepID=A0ABN3SZQ4_9ACTN